MGSRRARFFPKPPSVARSDAASPAAAARARRRAVLPALRRSRRSSGCRGRRRNLELRATRDPEQPACPFAPPGRRRRWRSRRHLRRSRGVARLGAARRLEGRRGLRHPGSRLSALANPRHAAGRKAPGLDRARVFEPRSAGPRAVPLFGRIPPSSRASGALRVSGPLERISGRGRSLESPAGRPRVCGLHVRLEWKAEGDPRNSCAHFSLSAVACPGVRPRGYRQIQPPFGPLSRSVDSGCLCAPLVGSDPSRPSPGRHRSGAHDGVVEREHNHDRASDSGARRASDRAFAGGDGESPGSSLAPVRILRRRLLDRRGRRASEETGPLREVREFLWSDRDAPGDELLRHSRTARVRAGRCRPARERNRRRAASDRQERGGNGRRRPDRRNPCPESVSFDRLHRAGSLDVGAFRDESIHGRARGPSLPDRRSRELSSRRERRVSRTRRPAGQGQGVSGRAGGDRGRAREPSGYPTSGGPPVRRPAWRKAPRGLRGLSPRSSDRIAANA